MFRWMVAKILRRPLVYLEDFDGSCCLRIAKRTPFGLLTAKRTSVRTVILNDDGSVSGCFYTDKWKYKE